MTLLVTVAVCLLTFETVRTVGVGMLVSAGLLAVCLGVAAGPFLGSLYSRYSNKETKKVDQK